MKSGELIPMRDSAERSNIGHIKEEIGRTIVNVGIKEENGLNRQIGVLQRVSEYEWVRKHVEQNKLFSENILTNMVEQCIIKE